MGSYIGAFMAQSQHAQGEAMPKAARSCCASASAHSATGPQRLMMEGKDGWTRHKSVACRTMEAPNGHNCHFISLPPNTYKAATDALLGTAA